MFQLDPDNIAVLQRLCRALHPVNQLGRVSPATIFATLGRHAPVSTGDRPLLKVLGVYPKVLTALIECKRHCSWFVQCDRQQPGDEVALFSPVSVDLGEDRKPGDVLRVAIDLITDVIASKEKASDDVPGDLRSILAVLKQVQSQEQTEEQAEEQAEGFTACPAVPGMSA